MTIIFSTARHRRSSAGRARLAGPITLSLLLCACAVGGEFEPPVTKIDPVWLDAPTGTVAERREDWWRLLNDPVLDELIAQAIVASPDVKTAAAKVMQAAAQARISVAERNPEIGASGALDAYRIPPELAERIDNIDPFLLRDSLNIQASWEIDFWGKALSAARADRADLLASRAAYRAALVSLLGNLSSGYVDYRVLQAQHAIANESAVTQADLARLATIRYREGAISSQPVAEAEASAAQARAQAETLSLQLAQARHGLALLAGMTDAEITPIMAEVRTVPVAPAPPDPGLPRDLLRSRPDVEQAELAARAQFERLNVAKANLYPSFSLAGTLGFSATTVGDSSLLDIFSWSSRSVSGGLSFLVPVFDRGRLTAQVRLQDAVVQQSLIAYEQAVLAAQRDVTDALSQTVATRRSLAALQRAERASAAAVRVVAIRYREGATDRQSLLKAEASHLAIRDSLVQAQGNTALSWVAINRALGGGGATGPIPIAEDSRE